MKTFVSFQYSDRSTSVLLIVSLAGIKVCSPDGKVSIVIYIINTYIHTRTHTRTISLVRKRRKVAERKKRDTQRERGERKAETERRLSRLHVSRDEKERKELELTLSVLFARCQSATHKESRPTTTRVRSERCSPMNVYHARLE